MNVYGKEKILTIVFKKSAFTKPMVGFFDMASNVTAGIRETTTVFEGGEVGRERVPRYSGKDGIITVSKL
jgi:vacuolar protein sorting-associated protein 13A/C